jgi:tetratricopeptide (TPR) repeat protein
MYIEPIMAAHTAPPADEIEWIRKDKARAGERDILTLRLQIAGAVTGVLLVLGIIGTLIVLNVPEARRLVFAPTRTPTLTPSNTPTATPGITPTPSPTLDTTRFPTYTPSATIPLTLTPFGRLDATPRPTALNLPVQAERAILDSARLIEQGEYEIVVATLQVERQSLGSIYNPNPYYFEAVALARSGDFQGALNLMLEAEEGLTRVSSTDVTRYRPLVNLGFAEVFVAQALDAFARRSPAEASQRLTEARNRLEEALTLDPRLARAYVLIAQTYTLQGEYAAAIAQLDAGLAFPELASDVTLIIEKGWTYLAEGRELLRNGSQENALAQFERAEYQGFYALYLNPFDESAHQLRIQSALARQQPGLAVLYTETYLLYHPDNVTALSLLGEARDAEGNTLLAFDAFARALETGDTSPSLVNALLSRAALYTEQRRFDLALADYNRALEGDPNNLEVRALRMVAAYTLGDYDTALADGDALLDSGTISNSEVRLMRARVLIDRAGRGEQTPLTEALEELASVSDSELTPALAAIANEYRARANNGLANYEQALTDINRAIEIGGDSGSRRYLRGQLRQQLGDFLGAVRDYEWILGWNEVYGYAFAEDVVNRLIVAQEQQQDIARAATQTAAATQTGTPQP